MSKGRPNECKTQVSEEDRVTVCRLRKAYNLPCNNCKYNEYCQSKGLTKEVNNGYCIKV